MRVTFVGMCFQAEHFLESAIEAVKPFGRVCFVEGPTEFYQRQGFQTSTDRTNQILADLIGEENVVHGQFVEKDEEAAATEQLIPSDSEFIFWVDSDEIWRKSDLEKIFAILDSGQVDSMAFKADSFFGGFDRVLSGWERAFEVHRVMRWRENPHWVTHRPPTVNAADGVPWRLKRHLSHNETEAMGLSMPHYSYVTPSQVKAKAAYYADYSPAICIKNYYRDVFIPWVAGTPEQRAAIEDRWRGPHNFLPSYRGDCFSRPFEGEHPEEIRKRLPGLNRRLKNEIAYALLDQPATLNAQGGAT